MLTSMNAIFASCGKGVGGALGAAGGGVWAAGGVAGGVCGFGAPAGGVCANTDADNATVNAAPTTEIFKTLIE
jgi:hypothetical protein